MNIWAKGQGQILGFTSSWDLDSEIIYNISTPSCLPRNPTEISSVFPWYFFLFLGTTEHCALPAHSCCLLAASPSLNKPTSRLSIETGIYTHPVHRPHFSPQKEAYISGVHECPIVFLNSLDTFQPLKPIRTCSSLGYISSVCVCVCVYIPNMEGKSISSASEYPRKTVVKSAYLFCWLFDLDYYADYKADTGLQQKGGEKSPLVYQL